jgi:selenocysteine lyase/cysteine desulfurase
MAREEDATMLDRRSFLGALTSPLAVACLPPAPRPEPWAAERLAELAADGRPPEEAARDEDFWFAVQEAFTTDRSLVNFNNGGVSPSPAPVQDALARYLAHANDAPPYVMWQLQEPQKETVRAHLARVFGCDAEEIAITRNASEGLQICQFGFDLEPGDEVLTTTQDYPRMIQTWRQRERRDGIKLVQVPVPVPAEDAAEVVRRFEAAIGERTRLILLCHVINLTGQVMPVREVCALGRERGIPVIVDGAHAFAHLVFKQADLGCEYYATSLHKWLCAPFGTGLLYVARERIPDLWPLMAAPEKETDDIRKFEQIGTHSVPVRLAIAQALTFHEGLGPERKLARMVYLRDRWALRLAPQGGVRLHTSLKPGLAGGIANVQIEGVDSAELAGHLWKRHRILVTTIKHDEVEGIRVSPSVYSTLEEVDRFAEAMEDVLANGLPG